MVELLFPSRGSRRSVFEPLGLEAVVQMDVELAEGTGAAVDAFVRGAGRGDQDLAAGRLDRGVADGEGGPAFLDDEDLGVGVAVQLWAAARFAVEEDQTGGNVA